MLSPRGILDAQRAIIPCQGPLRHEPTHAARSGPGNAVSPGRASYGVHRGNAVPGAEHHVRVYAHALARETTRARPGKGHAHGGYGSAAGAGRFDGGIHDAEAVDGEFAQGAGVGEQECVSFCATMVREWLWLTGTNTAN